MLFPGQELTYQKPDAVVKAGISHVPEGRQIFADLRCTRICSLAPMSTGAREPIVEALYGRSSIFPGVETAVFGKGRVASRWRATNACHRRASHVSAQTACSWMSLPSGSRPSMVDQILDIVRTLGEGSIPILLVEQNVAAALKIA